MVFTVTAACSTCQPALNQELTFYHRIHFFISLLSCGLFFRLILACVPLKKIFQSKRVRLVGDDGDHIGFRACRLKTNSQARGRVFSGKILSESFSLFVFSCAIHFNTFLDSEGENYLVMMVMLLLFTPSLRLCFNVRSQIKIN